MCVCVCVCLKDETAVVGGPRDRGFREESPLRLAGFITVLASHGKPTHRRKYRHTWTHMYLVFYGLLSWEALIISSRTALKSLTRFFHTIFFNTVSFFAPSLSNSTIYFFFLLTPIRPLSLSPTLLGFLSAGLLSDREGFVRCQIPELRDQRQTKRLVTYCSILERQKMESLIDRDIAFFPPFLPRQLFHSFNPPLWL